ncbi:MAG TPA: cytidylate kinase family protein [Candidatus Paceibacterota bacterium]|nr:cytidylate kinase family protein [Candidatus Paceibacterota bacterium]
MNYTPFKLTTTGLAGTGKSVAGKKSKERFNLEHRMSAGDYYRALAEEKRMTLLELEALAEKDPSIDFEVDRRTSNFGMEQQSFVFDGRLAWNCVPGSLKVLLVCPDKVRIGRIAERDGVSYEKAEHETLTRERSIRDRFLRYYGIERFDDPAHFDLVIDTDENDPDQTVQKIAAAAIIRGIVFPQGVLV